MSAFNVKFVQHAAEFFKSWRTTVPNLTDFPIRQKQLSEVFYKKGVVKNFIKSTGKHLCWSAFL